MYLYRCFDSSRPETLQTLHFYAWQEAIGDEPGSQRLFFERDHIKKLSMVLSKTKSDRLLNLKPGSKLKLSRLHSCGDLYIYRMTEDEINNKQAQDKIESEIKSLRSEIYKKTEQEHKEIKKLEKELRKLKRG